MPSPDTRARTVASTGPVDDGATRTVAVRVVADVDPATWAVDHARGLRPDASPYGLERLAEHGLSVRPDAARAPGGRLSRRIDAASRHRGGGLEWWSGVRTPLPRDADVVVCWDERTGVPALARRNPRPVATGVIWLTDASHRARWAGVARRALPRSAAVWALSDAQLGILRDGWGIAPARLHRVPFGIDERFWSPSPDQGPADGIPTVLGVGNDRHRDHERLVAAVAGLPVRLSVVTALPVAVPPEVGERVTSLSHVDLRSRYAAAAVVAVLVRPNTHVSGVTSVLEAQAMGRPVVVSDTPGMRDYVRPGVSAELVPVGDTDAARRAIAGLAADPDRAAEMGRAGREFVRAHATSAGMVAHLAAILRAL